MDQLVRQIDNATHQRNDAYSLAQDDTTALPGLEVREDCPSCGHHVGRRTVYLFSHPFVPLDYVRSLSVLKMKPAVIFNHKLSVRMY